MLILDFLISCILYEILENIRPLGENFGDFCEFKAIHKSFTLLTKLYQTTLKNHKNWLLIKD